MDDESGTFYGSAPKDIVPRKSTMTLADLATLDAQVGTPVTITEPGKLKLDSLGFPAGFGPDTTTTALLVSPVLDIELLEKLGGDPDDYPNLRFLQKGQQP